MNINSIVRRLCPPECCRLMNFPDDYLAINGKDTPDSPQFRGCGNSWGRNNARWVNLRIEKTLRDAGVVAKDRTVQYATTCSGVECHTLAVRGQNWHANFYSEIEKFPCEVLAHHYPDVPNLGDMTKVDGKPYNLDVFSGGTPCFTAGNMVLTETGYRPIEQIKVGDRVVTHTGRLQKVVKVGHKTANNIIRVKIGGRPEFLVTANHPFLCADAKRDNRRKSATYARTILSNPRFVAIGEAKGKAVCLSGWKSSEITVPQLPVAYDATDNDIIELAGWYVGDGYIRRYAGKSKKNVILCLNDAKLEVFRKRFGKSIHWSEAKGRTATKVQISCTALANWLKGNFGEKAIGKTVPAWLIAGQQELRKSFIAGYLATDGFVLKNGETGFTTISKSLAYGLADLLGDMRVYYAPMPATCVIEGRVCNQHDQYTAKKAKSDKTKFHHFGGRSWVRVREVETISDPMTVYNLEVEGDHTYICNGFCVHNCQSVSVAGKRHGMAEDSGTRSSLAYHWMRIGKESLNPGALMLWENVPGAFSAGEGRDFTWFIHRLNEEGFAVAWRAMDMQWIWVDDAPKAVPQRRRRIWLVAQKGTDWRFPAQVLFERTAKLGALHPNRIVDGRIIRSEEEEAEAAFDLFGGCEPDFNAGSRADWIPFSAMPGNGNDFLTLSDISLIDFFRKIGNVQYCGGIFDGAPEVANISARLRENIGNAGCAVGGRIITLKMPEWSAGIQLPDGVDCPAAFNGTVCGLSDVLFPMTDELLKYILSPRACSGILRRAENRGKKLPEPLERTLHEQIANWANGAFGDALAADKADEEAEAESGEETDEEACLVNGEEG